MSGRWFRFYDAALDDPKVQRLSGDLFKLWTNLLCLASRNGGALPKPADVAFALRTTPAEFGPMLKELVHAGLFDRTDRGWEPHNWCRRQYKSDVSNERVKRHRERQRNVTETPSESETEAETEQTPAKAGEGEPTRTPSKPRGTRLPPNWRPDHAGRSFAAERGLEPDSTADAFADYWSAATGRTSSKLDWNAAFRTWCRRDADQPKGRGGGGFVRPPRGNDTVFERLARIASRDPD